MKNLYTTIAKRVKRSVTVLLAGMAAGYANVNAQTMTARSLGHAHIGGYYEYLPEGYDRGSSAYPLLIFLHGMGEEGNGTTQLDRVLRNGTPRYIMDGALPGSFRVNNRTFSFVMLFPQLSGPATVKDIQDLINFAKKQYRVDPARIYLTGLSRGGGGVETYASANNPEAQTLAAIAPVCGNYNPQKNLLAPQVIARNNLPVWAFHNDGDPTVPSIYTRNWVAMINAYRPTPDPRAKMTIFNSSSHDAWTKAYDPNYRENGLNVYEWMLQYTRGNSNSGSTGAEPPPKPAGNKRITVRANSGNNIYYKDAMNELGIQPGDTLCIAAGDYAAIFFANIKGTAQKPVVITNCDGLVRVGVNNSQNGGTTVFNFNTCQYVEVSGSGKAGLEYGFDINGTSTKENGKMFGMYLGMGSSDFNVHHLYIHDCSHFIMAKTTQNCNNPQYWDGAFVLRNLKIHHIKGRNSYYEGFYIGNSHYIMELECGPVKSHRLENVEIYNNDLQGCRWDGIQLDMASEGLNRVHHNRIVNYGQTPNSQQSNGICIGGGSTVDVYNNYIDKGYGAAICLFGSGVSRVFNNIILNTTMQGIFVDDRLVFNPVTAYIYNNTLVNNTETVNKTVVTIYANGTKIPHKVFNNLVVSSKARANDPMAGFYLKAGTVTVPNEFGNNLTVRTVAEAGFVNAAAGNYRLQPSSKAVNAGRDMKDEGLATDMDNAARPQGGAYDIGAYELKEAAPVNSPPVAFAGTDLVVTLPADRATLDGSLSGDTDGSIKSWAWKKIAGPGGGTISSPNSASTLVTGLQPGAYVYELTVTDNSNATASDRVIITVLAKPGDNRPPVAVARENVFLKLPVNFTDADGSGSYDPDGRIVKYQWTQLTGPARVTITTPAAARTRMLNFMQPGDYSFQLVVTDNGNATSKVIWYVKVENAGGKEPFINLYPNPVQGNLTLKVGDMPKEVSQVLVRIYGMDGVVRRLILYPISGQMQTSIDVSALSPGFYTLEVREGNNANAGAKWVKTFIKLPR